MTEEWTLACTPEMVAKTRHRIRLLAAAIAGQDDDLTAEVEVMAAELVTNALKHGGGDKARVRVTAGRQVLRVEVHDQGAPSPERATADDPLSDHGRGLLIVAMLATRWGLEHGDGGTTAWFEVRLPCSPPGQAGQAVPGAGTTPASR
jgi:anti-sigma regulatory factor (Ser/Thr protein kinase)